MTGGCPPVERLGALAALPDGHPDRVHAAACPRCRALLAAWEDFRAGAGLDPAAAAADLDAAPDPDAESRLEAALEEALAADARAARRARRRAAWPLLAAAAVLSVTGVWLAVTTQRGRAPEMRGAVEVAGPLEPAVAPDGSGSGAVVTWGALDPPADYEVVVTGPDLADLVTLPAGGATRLVLRRADLPGPPAPGAPLMLQVVARRGGTEVARSRTVTLPLP